MTIQRSRSALSSSAPVVVDDSLIGGRPTAGGGGVGSGGAANLAPINKEQTKTTSLDSTMMMMMTMTTTTTTTTQTGSIRQLIYKCHTPFGATKLGQRDERVRRSQDHLLNVSRYQASKETEKQSETISSCAEQPHCKHCHRNSLNIREDSNSNSNSSDATIHPNTTEHHYHQKSSQTKRIHARAMSLIAFVLVVSLSLSLDHRVAGETSHTHLISSASSLAPTSISTERNGSQAVVSELVAIGATSLLEPQAGAAQNAPTQTVPGRLVDRIASAEAAAAAAAVAKLNQPTIGVRPNKLDYIVDFMRANRLTKFCDLLTSNEKEVRSLSEQLNSLEQFTLFVPTNEALLLMPTGQLEQITSRAKGKQHFLMVHATDELVVPKLTLSSLRDSGVAWSSNVSQQQQQPTSASTSLVLSLAGSPLRVTTTALPGAPLNQSGLSGASSADLRTTKLELIVNGANVISGHSYALQEPNNSSATYAIVHLIDRALYPDPTVSLLAKIRSLAPRWASYLEQANDPQLKEFLESPQRLSTLFLPNDDAFGATPPKLINQLESNRTFLRQFLRNHLVEGLFYSGQLANSAAIERLNSISGIELQFEAKTLQSRTLVLVNSIPILEPDVMSLNGVVHLIARPIFESHLLADCHCGTSNQTSATNHQFRQPTSANYTDSSSVMYEKLWPNLGRQNVAYELDIRPTLTRNNNINWLRASASAAQAQPDINLPPESTVSGNGIELEREETAQSSSRAINGQNNGESNNLRVRAQRSGLVAQNNRDFYRPSAAPLNVLATESQASQQQQNARRNEANPLLGSKGTLNEAGPILISKDELSQLLGANDSLRSMARTSNAQTNENPIAANSNNNNWNSQPANSPTSDLFEADRYKVVLNATSRQRLREQLRSDSSMPSGVATSPQFVYDRPLVTASSVETANSGERESSLVGSRRPYVSTAAATATSLNTSGWSSAIVGQPTYEQLSLAASRQQRLLKFQPEDARDPLPGTRLPAITSNQTRASLTQQPVYYDIFGPNNLEGNVLRQQQQQQQMTAKTVAPSGFNGCAFYDTECKQLVAKLVRLPPSIRPGGQKSLSSPSSSSSSSSSSAAKMLATASNQTFRIVSNHPVGGNQHLDSTFGESPTTENPTISNSWTRQQAPKGLAVANVLTPSPASIRLQQQQQQLFNRINSPRLSPLNQPLPPWGEDENRNLGRPNWRAQDGDITRLNGVNSKKTQPSSVSSAGNFAKFSDSSQALSKQQQQTAPLSSIGPQVQLPPQILLVPIRVLQDAQIVSNNSTNQQQLEDKAIFLTGPTQQRLQASPHNTAPVMFTNTNQQYHTPTPYSVSPMTTHLPPMFSNNNNHSHSLARLTNFSAIESSPIEENFFANQPTSFDENTNHHSLKPNHYQPNQMASNKNQFHQFASPELKQVPRAPVAHRKQQQRPIEQIQFNSSDFFNRPNSNSSSSELSSPLISGEKQARKIVRLQPAPANSPFVIGDNDFSGDISITSARLTANQQSAKLAAGGLATQASNQALNVSGNVGPNFVRSVPIHDVGGVSLVDAQQQQQPSADFFQNRTIAEIMDDSGLRIDGQQVTFGRLRECLTEADLSSLVTQTGNSVTIFMPTDQAFVRLVQQQTVLHQRDRQQTAASASRSSIAGRLLDPARKYLIPLVARRAQPPPARHSTEGSGSADRSAALVLSAPELEASATSAADRLTLDCSSNQVRQILLDHLSARLVTPKQLQSDIAISSLSGRQLLLSSVPSKKIVVVDGQPVIAATRAKNGMVYVVNKFLNLSQQVPNVVDLIETQPNLTTFLSYLSFSGLSDRLKRETGPLTVFAPTNEAFEQLSGSARQLINSDPAALLDILRSHVVEGAQFGKLIPMRNRLKTMNQDQIIEAKVIKPNVYSLGNQMTSIRLVGTSGNGVVNAIDRLIVPSWLRVTMTKPLEATSLPSTTPTSNRINGVLSSTISGELENVSPGTRNNVQATNGLNLPVISSKPMRFEQPIGRLTTPSAASNSFLLDNGVNSLSTNLADFELPTGSVNNVSEGLDDSSLVVPVQRSPFLRVANNLTNNATLASRFPSPIATTTSSVANVTKNMQLIEKLANLMQARRFVKYLFRSKVSELLKPDMNYVVLVPTDQAIEKLPKQIIDMLERDPERLADLVNYHVLDTTFEYINAIPDGQTLNTLNEKDILFNWHRNNTILTASGAVVMGGIQEENIALLIVDRVLYPTPGDILNIISKSPILSNFTALVRNAGLENQLTLAGPYTLFAPSDVAFNQLKETDLDFLRRNKETARRFLLRHLSQPAVFTSSIALSNTTSTANNNNSPSRLSGQLTSAGGALVPTMIITNSLGEDLTLRQRNDYFSVNDVNFSYADVAATNGVVHVIDGLL